MKPFDVDEFLRMTERRQARRFLADPIPITGFGVPLDFARGPGRAPLIQVPEIDLDLILAQAMED
jgi:hypothetical protein